MRPVDLAEFWNTSKQNINNMKVRCQVDFKKDRHGNTLVRGNGN